MRQRLAAASPPRPRRAVARGAGPDVPRRSTRSGPFSTRRSPGSMRRCSADFREQLGRLTTPVERYVATRRADPVPDQRRGRAHLARAVHDGARSTSPARASSAWRRPATRRTSSGPTSSTARWARSSRGIGHEVVSLPVRPHGRLRHHRRRQHGDRGHGQPVRGATRRTSNDVRLSRVKLLVPVIPPTFYAAGVNYREHVTEMAQRRGVKPEFPPNADVGYRANNALVATDEPIVIPRDATDQVQYEGRAGGGDRQALQARVGGRGARLRLRLHDRQRRQRAHLAARRPHVLARQEHRHLQADGPVDRHRPRSRRRSGSRSG